MKLKDISTYEEKGRFYMKLTYVYEDDKGNEHTRIYPKIDFPVDMSEDLPIMLPDFIHSSIFEARDPKVLYGEVFVHTGSVSVPADIRIVERIGPGSLKKPVPDISTDVSRYNRFDDVYFADYISGPCIKEMTLEEIEKKLGYKVKIVSEEKDVSKHEEKSCDSCSCCYYKYYCTLHHDKPCYLCKNHSNYKKKE